MSATTLQQVPAGTYGLDPVHSTFGFAVKHNSVSLFRGQFEEVEAKLDAGVLTGTAKVESVKTAIPDLHAHLVSEEFFDAANTPTIAFRSTEIRIAEDGSSEVDGELTIRGITRPVSAKGSFGTGVGLAGAEVVGFDLEATVDRRAFGLDWQAPLPSGGDAVAWDVTLQVHLELAKA
jgi:polyisoprenoid-binding protein YceI